MPVLRVCLPWILVRLADAGVGHEGVVAVVAAAQAAVVADAELGEGEAVDSGVDVLRQAEAGRREAEALVGIHVERARETQPGVEDRGGRERVGVVGDGAVHVIFLVDAAFGDRRCPRGRRWSALSSLRRVE